MTANQLARLCAYSARAEEWGQFVSAVTPVMALAARRVSLVWGEPLDPAVSEILQEVFLKLCEGDRRVLREFEDRGEDSILKLLRVVTASIATDYFRRLRAEKRGGRSTVVPLNGHRRLEDAADLVATEAVEWPVLIANVDGLMRKLHHLISQRDRSLFWLYYRHGLTAESISRIPAMNLTAKGVESALARCSRVLRAHILEGRPIPEQTIPFSKNAHPVKGFSSVVAIDSMKHP